MKDKIISIDENICCGNFEKYAKLFAWMFDYDDNRNKRFTMPHVYVSETNYRINYCPTCGYDIRDVQITSDKFNSFN